jgi:hypothetical protein
VTARFPFPDGQAAAVMMAHLTADPLPLERNVPECLEWTILRCLEKEREDRFLDARELARALELCEAVLRDGPSIGTAHLSLAGGRLILAEPDPPSRRAGGAVLLAFAVTAALLVCLTVATIGGFGLVRGLSTLVAAPAPAPAIVPAPETETEAAPEPEPEPEAEPEPEPEPEPAPALAAEPAPAPAPVARPRPRPAPTPAPPPPAPLDVRSSDLKDPW